MNEDFYKDILINDGIEIVIPSNDDMDIIHKIIYNELCLGDIKSSSKIQYLNIINKMQNINGIILGCTEIGLLINQNDLDIKVFDTTVIHAKQAVKFALE